MREVTSRLVYGAHPDAAGSLPAGEQPVDMVSSVDTHLLNVVAEAESFQWDFDLRDAWLTKARFNTLIRQYIDPVAAENWLDTVEAKLGKRKRGTAVMRTNIVQKRGNTNRPSRQWGSCMLNISFRRVPYPQITLYSRTSYFGYIGYLDMTAAHVLAQEVSKRVGIPVEDMRFVWQIEDAQWSWKSLSYMFQDEDRAQRLWDARDALAEGGERWDHLFDSHPGLGVAALWFDRFLLEDEDNVKYGDMTWGGCARVRRRYHTEVQGYDYGEKFEGWEGIGKLKGQSKRFRPLPSCMSSTLDLSALSRLKTEPSEEVRATMASFTEDGCECLYGDMEVEGA
jgi:hypothetical protein